MKKILLIPILLFSFISLNCIGQSFDKQNISVLPFSGWDGENDQHFQSLMTEKIIARVVASNKFNVITSDDDELAAIAKEMRLQLSGFVDESTAVEVGYRRGVSKFIVGNFTGNSVTFEEALYNDDGDLLVRERYVATVRATIKMLDIASGQYIQSSEASAYGRASSKQGALHEALERLAHEITDTFKKHFLIQAFVKNTQDPEVYLDRGGEMGVKQWMTFEVFDIESDAQESKDVEIPAGTPVYGIIKITEVTPNSSKGLIMGKHQPVRTGMILREMRDKPDIKATIIEKKLNTVTLDRGQNFQIKTGSYFTVLKPVKGRNDYGKIKRVGMIYVDGVQENISSGKILKGRYRFTNGMEVEQSKGTPFEAGGSIGYSQAFRPKPIRSNTSSGSVSVNNGEPGLVTVETDYLDDYSWIIGIERYSVTGFFKDILHNYTIEYGLDYFRVADGELNAWVPKLGSSYQIGILPEVLYLSPGVELGCAYMQQDIDVVNQISDQERDFARSWSAMIGAKLEASLHLGNLAFFAGVNYQQLRFNKWKYRARTGKVYDDGDAETKAYRLPNALVPYPNVDLSGIFFSGGVRIELPVW